MSQHFQSKSILMNLQRKTDKFVISARELSSRGMSFIIVMLGVLLQASHTTLLMYDIAAFTQTWLKLTVALGIGIFISSSLAIFTLKYDGTDPKLKMIINVFFYFEIFTNVFYYWNSLIFSKGFDQAVMQDWLYLIIAMPFSFVMPFAIKQFAGIISTEEKLKFGDIDSDEVFDITASQELLTKLRETVDHVNKLETRINEDSEKWIKRGENFQLEANGKQTVVTLK